MIQRVVNASPIIREFPDRDFLYNTIAKCNQSYSGIIIHIIEPFLNGFSVLCILIVLAQG